MRKYPSRQNLDDLGAPLQLPDELDAQAIAKLYKRWALAPLEWCRYFFPNHFRLKTPEFHREISRNWLYLPNKIQAYEAPRGFAKTTLAEFLTFHSIVFGGLRYIIFISQTEDVAGQRLWTLRHEAQNNRLFRMFHGDFVSEKWGEKELILENKKSDLVCKLTARGLGQQILGAKFLDQRPQLIVIDDPEDIKIAENPKNVDKDERWLLKEVEPALADDGRIIMISTPVTADCLIERLSRRNQVHFQRFSCLTDQGVPLWPEHKNARQLAELQNDLAESGHLYIYFTEYLCNPISPDRHPIQEEMFEYYTPKDIDLAKSRFNVFMTVDLAIGEKKTSCFSALVVFAVDEQDTWYILDTYQTRSDWYEFSKDVYGYAQKWNPMAVGVELAATQGGFWDVLRLTAEKHHWAPIHPLAMKPDKDKDIRIRRLIPRFKTKRIKFLRSQVEIKKQLILHPEYKFRDLADALAYGETFCYPPGANQPRLNKPESWRLFRADTDEEMEQEAREQRLQAQDDMEDWEL